jgi:hypothetical protein
MNSIRTRIIKGDKADPNPSRLGNEMLNEFEHKVKTQSNMG